MKNKENNENKGIPFIYPVGYHLNPFEEGLGYENYISQAVVMRDAMENTLLEEKEPWMI